jgi:hypothetical protein
MPHVRTAYPVKGNPYALKFQVWNENLILANEAIAEGVLPLAEMFRYVYDSNLGAHPLPLRRSHLASEGPPTLGGSACMPKRAFACERLLLAVQGNGRMTWPRWYSRQSSTT